MPISVFQAKIPNAGLPTYRNLDVGTAGAMVFSTKGAIFEYYVRNNAVTVRHLKFYDKASAATNTDTPLRTYTIPATGAANLFVAEGIKFDSGCSIRVTTGIADNDNGAPSANDVNVNIGYR